MTCSSQTDAISRSASLETINEVDISDCTDIDSIIDRIYAEVASVPALDVAPVVHARWIPTHGSKMVNGHLLFADGFECSKCKKGHSGSNYCEECGAKMDGEAE